MSPRLAAGDFAEFFGLAHGYEPFPWQQELVTRVLADGRWPDVVDVPTGLGKTSLIDAAVFAAAARPDAGRRRVFFVVDRRLVVDAAFEHARALQRALSVAGGACARVAAALRQAGDDPGAAVLQVERMRGGLTWSSRWLERPDRYAVVTATVDQIGSRLLFRGYGTGEQMRPIDAALTGADSLIIIDEAHLATPFTQTLADAVALDEAPGRERWSRPPTVITTSATAPPRPGAVVHRIGAADELDPEAGRRLRAVRRMHLVTAPARRTGAGSAVAGLLSGWARALAGDPGSGRVVAVVCNTVARARAVADQLAGGGADTVLLTGRIRPVDRDYLLREEWYERVRADPRRGPGWQRPPGPPLILVATQTIEVGADIDADALVTESASLDALTQRLGRLNRLGQSEPGGIAVVVHDPAAGAGDPVYGPTREATWQWLTSLTEPLAPRPGAAPTLSALGPGLDVSPLRLRHLTGSLDPGQAKAMRSAAAYVPVLGAATLDAWARTSPAPHPDPPVGPYLHGITGSPPDVTVVWRADLTGDPEHWPQILNAVPPAPEEAIEVPAAAVRRWLQGDMDRAAAIGDVEDSPDQDAGEQDQDQGGNSAGSAGFVARYRAGAGTPAVEPIRARDVAPGDTIIVPARRGGCDRFGWNPASRHAVTDVADVAYRRGHPLLRLTPELSTVIDAYAPDLAGPASGLIAWAQRDAEEGEGPEAAAYRRALTEIVQSTTPLEGQPPLTRNLRSLAASCTAVLYPPPGDTGAAGHPAGVLLAARGGGQAGDTSALSSSAPGEGGQIGLPSHQRAVARRSAEFARNLGLGKQLAASVSMAARLHDEGKRDPRFQAMLHGRSDRTLPASAPVLAKSGLDPADRAAFRRARQLSGYPAAMRHEALSARIARLILDADAADADPGLVIHLIAAHHGYSRPLLPPVTDPDPRDVFVACGDVTHSVATSDTVDWDSPGRFAALNQRYGRWGLALLETIVRLADMWCSERGEHDEDQEASQ